MTKQQVFKGALVSGMAFTALMAATMVLWRRIIWGDLYAAEGFFGFDEPSAALVAFGLGTYFLVGMFFAMLYGHLRAAAGSVSTVRTGVMFGVIYWLSANLDYVGRVPLESPGLFLLLEGVGDAVVFGLFALVLQRVFRSEGRVAAA